ncbi:MAG: GNAT family N-acetyltransferase [Spirochaetes bacterium]|nr:GNAT family N-acetyltransferase [Spirochaetota bacterium]
MQESAIELYSPQNDADIEAMHDLCAAAFAPRTSREFFADIIANDPCFDNTAHRRNVILLRKNGRVASGLVVFDRTQRFKSGDMRVGCIGSVATHPDFRGQGLMRNVMEAAVSFMRSEGYALSYLFGDQKLYERFGYRNISAAYSRITVPALNVSATIRPYVDDDLEHYAAIYAQYNSGRSGTIIRSREYFRRFVLGFRLRSPRFFTVIDGGHAAGYFHMRYDAQGIPFRIGEIAAADGKHEIVLLAALAYSKSLQAVELDISGGNDIPALLTTNGIAFTAGTRPEGMYLALLPSSGIQSTESFIASVERDGDFTFYHADHF